jgi:hypothetical protein
MPYRRGAQVAAEHTYRSHPGTWDPTRAGSSLRLNGRSFCGGQVQIHETPQDFSQGVLRGGRDLKLCVNTGPTGSQGDPANDSALLRLAQDGESEPKRTGEGCACHNVTDDRAELIALVLSTALAKWRSSPDPEELRGILLRLLVALESRE